MGPLRRSSHHPARVQTPWWQPRFRLRRAQAVRKVWLLPERRVRAAIWDSRARIWIKHQRRPPDARRNLLEHLLPFPNYWSVHECEAGDVPARMGQTGDKALSDWIVDKIKYDRNVSRRLSNCSDYR